MGKRIQATPAECTRVREIFDRYRQHPEDFPLSFVYGGTAYSGLGDEFCIQEHEQDEANAIRQTILADHPSGLTVQVCMTLYPAYAAIEWTAYFLNRSTQPLPELRDVLAADLSWEGERPRLYGNIGDDPFYTDIYRPVEMDIVPGMTLDLQPFGGRPTSMGFPYYDLAYGKGGVRIAVGWPGRWRCRFFGGLDQTRLCAGQYTLDTHLQPGEKIRTPLMAFLYYDGRDRNRSVNLWRRWMMDCCLRRIDGQPFPPKFALAMTCENEDLCKTSEEGEVHLVKTFVDAGSPVDVNWVDAGWYRKNPHESVSRWEETGELSCDPVRYPTGFRALSDYLHSVGSQLLVWFELERVLKGTGSTIEGHKEWLMEISARDGDIAGPRAEEGFGWCGANYLPDLGNPEYRSWLVEEVDRILCEGNIDIFRQDFNMEPILFWTQNDEDGRLGMRENLYIQGYLAFWDELIRRHPRMMIDSCASGGRRNDLETLRRSLPFHKTDFDYSYAAQKQAMHQALFAIYPYFAAAPVNVASMPKCQPDRYTIESCFVPFLLECWNVDDPHFDMEKVQAYTAPWYRMNALFTADYYPLTPWNREDNEWIGWEFFDAEKGEGFVQAFRRENAPDEVLTVRLLGLEPQKRYRIETWGADIQIMDGSRLLEEGLQIRTPPRSSCILFLSEDV